MKLHSDWLKPSVLLLRRAMNVRDNSFPLRQFRAPFWRSCVFVALLGSLSACGSCGDRRADPRAHISRNAEGVIEITDLGVLAKRQTQLSTLLAGVVTPAQLDGLKQELTRWLGFDPTDKKKLIEAGLATKGRMAGSFSEGGRDILWVLPVSDEKKFLETVQRLVSTRRKIDATTVQDFKPEKLTVYATAWGTETLPVAAVSVHKGLGFVGLGPKAPKLVQDALIRKLKDSVLSHPEYAPLDKALGQNSIARLIVPTATVSAAQALAGRANNVALPKDTMVDMIKSLGWALAWEGRQIALQGRFRMSPERIKEVQSVLKPLRSSPKLIERINGGQSVLTVQATGNPKKLIEFFNLPNTPIRKQYEAIVASVQKELGLDLEKDILSLLSGHAAASIRLIDLSGVSNLQAIMATPAALARYSVVLGIQGKDWKPRLDSLLHNFETQYQSKGLSKTSRKQGEFAVDSIKFNGQMLVESLVADDAWLLSNDDNQIKELYSSAKPSSASHHLSRLGGLRATLNVRVLRNALEQLDVGRLAGSGLQGPMVRAMLAKVLQVLGQFDQLEVKVEGVEDGVAIRAALDLSEVKSK
jgi:hypothetical protein